MTESRARVGHSARFTRPPRLFRQLTPASSSPFVRPARYKAVSRFEPGITRIIIGSLDRDGETKSMKISNFERWIYWVADNGNPIKILSRIYRIFVHAIYIKVCFHAKLIASAKYNCTRFSSTMFRVSMFRECVIDSRINYIRGTELMCHSACNGVSIQ